jgi:hypothetical protein
MTIRSKHYTNGARGQDCTLQIVGVCTNHAVVFAHFPDESHGIALKSDDHVGGDCCMQCHDVIDRRIINEGFEEHRDWYLRRAQNRTIRNRIEQGLMTMKGYKP